MADARKAGRADEAQRQRMLDACDAALGNAGDAGALDRLFSELRKHPEMAGDVWGYDSMPIFLLQEVIAPYGVLSTGKFGEKEGTRLCTTLNILQVLVGDARVKRVFVDARFPYYIYKYLVMSDGDPRHETVRISVLGVLASLLQNGDQYVHNQLKTTEVVPLLLKIVDLGSEASQLLAANVFGLIISSDEGLNYACQTFDRFSAINLMFNSLASQGVAGGSTKLVKATLRIYIRLCAKPHIRTLLSSKRPEGLFTDEAKAVISSSEECRGLLKTFSELIC